MIHVPLGRSGCSGLFSRVAMLALGSVSYFFVILIATFDDFQCTNADVVDRVFSSNFARWIGGYPPKN